MRIYHIPSWEHLLVCGQYEGFVSQKIVMLVSLLSLSDVFLLVFVTPSFEYLDFTASFQKRELYRV
jgi:hypothetical protein